MRKKTVGLYTPYLDVMGGGSKSILSILKVFDEAGYNVVIFWDKDLSAEIKDKLKIEFEHLRFEKNIKEMSFIEKAKKISPLEWMFYVTDGSYFFSPAKKQLFFAWFQIKNSITCPQLMPSKLPMWYLLPTLTLLLPGFINGVYLHK